ncbi:MAG: hypothetical protein KJ645_05865 [Planctomycetes bacterium]|nr:hypothetical protein [Planctomycetota bacterium]
MALRQPEKAKYWEAVFEEQAHSGKSIAGFCEERDIRPSKFYWWRRRLKTDDNPPLDGTEGFIELLSASGDPSRCCSSGITLICDNRFRLQLNPGFDKATLKQVLAVFSEPLK